MWQGGMFRSSRRRRRTSRRSGQRASSRAGAARSPRCPRESTCRPSPRPRNSCPSAWTGSRPPCRSACFIHPTGWLTLTPAKCVPSYTSRVTCGHPFLASYNKILSRNKFLELVMDPQSATCKLNLSTPLLHVFLAELMMALTIELN